MSDKDYSAEARALGREWFGTVLKPLRPTFRELAGASLFINLLALAQPIFMLQVYDRVVFYSGMSTLTGLAVGMAIAISFDLLLRTFRSRLVQRMATKIDIQVSRSLFKKLLSLELHELEAKTANFWMTLFRDIDVVRNTASGPSAFLAADLPFALIFVALAFVIAPPIAWVLVVSVCAFFLLTWRSGVVLERLNREERASVVSRDTLVAEFANTRTIVKALALDHTIIPAWENAQAHAIEHAIARGSRTDFFTNIGTSLTVMTSVTMTVFGAIAIVHQDLSVGSLIACNMLSSRILMPLNQLFGTFRSYTAARNSITRLGTIFSLAGERETSEVTLPRPVGRLVVERASYRHANADAPALENVNLTFQPGGLHVVIGRNGGGKTTLLKLMLGLYHPLTGRVLLDSADIAQFSRFDLRRWIGYVPQETVLFAGTIRDNIVKGHDGVDDATIVHAAQLAGLHQGVIDLPKGYATEIGEAGARLSGGFRQRIAIARALITDPPVLLMDEPSSHLDRPGEEHLRQSLLELARDHTIVIATHSPLLLEAAQTVAMIDRGRVTIAGPSAEVVARLTGRPTPVPPAPAPAPAQAAAAGN